MGWVRRGMQSGCLHAVGSKDSAGLEPWAAAPATATLVLPEAPAAATQAGLAATVLAATEQVRQQEEKMLVRLRLDLRHIVDELLKVRHARVLEEQAGLGGQGCRKGVWAG